MAAQHHPSKSKAKVTNVHHTSVVLTGTMPSTSVTTKMLKTNKLQRPAQEWDKLIGDVPSSDDEHEFADTNPLYMSDDIDPNNAGAAMDEFQNIFQEACVLKDCQLADKQVEFKSAAKFMQNSIRYKQQEEECDGQPPGVLALRRVKDREEKMKQVHKLTDN